MHGFARRVLPLLAQPGAPSPAGNKRNNKASHCSSEHLWNVYRELPQERKTLLHLKALIDPAIGKGPFLDAVRKAGLRPPGARAHTWASLNVELQALQRRGLLDKGFDCIPELKHAAAVEACASEDAAHLIDAVKTVIPKSDRENRGRPAYYYLPPVNQDFNLFRHFRLAIYANDEAGFSRLYKVVGEATSGPEGRPVLARFLSGFGLTQAWLEQLRPPIREMFAGHAVRMVIEHDLRARETEAIVQHYANTALGEAGGNLNPLLLRFDILSANFDRARQRIDALPESEAHLAAAHEASIAFLTGDNAAALAGFRNALKLLRKSLGKRKVALEAEAGLFHMLALVRANDLAQHAELRGLIDAATMEVTPYYLAHRSVEALLELIEGRQGKAQDLVKQLVEQPSSGPAANTILLLAALFVDAALVRKRAALTEAEYQSSRPIDAPFGAHSR